MNEVKRIPIEQLKLDRIWTNWSYLVTKDGKQTKKPHCKVNDSNTWITFEQASERCNAQNIGIGILFAEHETGYLICGVDIDAHNVDVNPLTKEILDMFKDTYIEKSPSGKGYHILFLVKSDAVPQNYKELYKQKNSTLDVECYLGGMTSRYFTFTGNRQSECDYLTDMTNTWLAFLDKYMGIPKRLMILSKRCHFSRILSLWILIIVLTLQEMLKMELYSHHFGMEILKIIQANRKPFWLL